MHIANEVTIFLIACAIGAGFGIFYDVFRILRIAIKHGKVAVFIEDLIFFLTATLVSLYYMIEINDGMMRGFLIFGELLGAICYFFTASVLILRFAHLIIGVIKGIVKWVVKFLFMPICRFLRKIMSSTSVLQDKCRLKIKKKIRKDENTLEKPSSNSI